MTDTIEDKWLRNWIEGIAGFIAKSKGETPEETEKEKQEIIRIFNEKYPELKEMSHRYYIRLKKAFGV